MIRVFFAAPEFFPPWRLDVDELFFRQLPLLDTEIIWSLRRDKAGPFGNLNHHGQRVHLPLRLNFKGVFGKFVNKLLQYGSEIILFIKLLFEKPFDIIQVRDRRYFFAFLGLVLSKVKGGKFVYWLSYPFPEHVLEESKRRGFPGSIPGSLRGYVSSLYVYHLIMPFADHVFVQSEQMKRNVISYNVDEQKVTPVPMGVSPRLFEWVASAGDLEVSPGKVVYLGTLARVRRMDQIIKAFYQARIKGADGHLFIIGEGDTKDERIELERLAESLGLRDYVTFTGFLPMEQAWQHVANAAVCLSPIYPTPVLDAGSPTKLFEYMALGRLVVANDHPEQREVLCNAEVGQIVPWGIDSFADAICEALTNKDLTDRARKMGPKWVRENRSYDKIALRVKLKYEQLVEDKP